MIDQSPVKVTIKAAQVGLTVAETLDNFYLAHFRGMNVIHTLQTKDVIKGFVFPKVNPIINNNPAIKKLVTIDSEGLKQVGNSFVYYRGANAESQAINISADVLKIDEYDRSNPLVVAMYPSRLDASEFGWKRYFSNPSMIGFGVDAMYKKSNMFHWFITCSHCHHRRWIDFEPTDDLNHYVDREKVIYACGNCHKEIYDNDRRNGEWVAKYPNREWHGYWFSQLMAPWKSARQIIDKYETEPIDVFHNMTLGKAYTPSDMIVDRAAILRACAPSTIKKFNVSIGVDQNVNNQIWVAGTPDGIFAYGKYSSCEEIERLKLMYKAVVVCDPNPYPTKPKQLADKYNDFYLCYFKIQEGMHIIKWNRQVVYADRTRLLDMVANDIVEGKMLFRQRPSELEEYIADWGNIYRTTVEKEDGRSKSEWLKKEGKNSDYSFATAYMRIGLSKILGSDSILLEPNNTKSGIIGDTTLGNLISETLNELDS